MSLSAIHGALSGHLAGYAEPKNLPVAWANREFSSPRQGAHLREALLPARTVQAALGDDGPNRESGVYQVDALGPAGKGFGPVSAIVDAIVARFSRGLRIPAGGGAFDVVIEGAWPGPPMIEDGRYRIPVSISYYAYTAP